MNVAFGGLVFISCSWFFLYGGLWFSALVSEWFEIQNILPTNCSMGCLFTDLWGERAVMVSLPVLCVAVLVLVLANRFGRLGMTMLGMTLLSGGLCFF